MPDEVDPGTPSGGAPEDLFRQIAENIREIFWMFDPVEQRVLYMNPAYEHITGRSAASVYGEPRAWRDIVHPADRTRVDEEFDSTADAGHNFEFRILRPDGEVRWVWARGLPLREEDGVVRRVVGVVEDITERKRAEAALEQALSLLRATLDATADGILALDATGRLTTFNRRLVELLRLPEFIVLKAGREHALLDWVTGQLEDPAPFLEHLAGMSRARDAEIRDVLEFKDGRVLELCSRPELLGNEVIGRVWSLHDVTARVRAERELRERNRRVELQNRVLLQLARQRIVGEADLRSALRHITEAAARHAATERVGLWLFDERRQRIRLEALYERSRRRHSSGPVIARDDAPRYLEALESERALAAHDVRTDPRTRELADPYCAPLGITSMLDAPIRVGGELVGVVCFEHVGPPRRWTVDDESFAASIGDLISIALEVAEHHRAEAAVRFLAGASKSLASSLDYWTTLDNAARVPVPELADWCVVALADGGEPERVAFAHRDPAGETLLREMVRSYPPSERPGDPAQETVRTGEPVLVAEVTDAALDAYASDERHRRMLRELGLRSYMIVPLRAHDQTLGALELASAERRFDAADLEVAQDVAGRVATAIVNARLFQAAQQASRSKSNFLAVVSHELRTPLAAIMGYADLLQMEVTGPLNETQGQHVLRIKLRSQELIRVLEEILSFARTDTGGETPRVEEVDLDRIVEEVADVARPLAKERGLAFHARGPERPATLRTDPDMVKHVLLDLLSNAVKFTERGRIDLDARMVDGRAQIRVRDTGIGVEPADRDRIFEPFVQIEEAMTREKGGTGIGLAVARRLARLLGGDVTVDSVPGEGSTFTVELPADGAERGAGGEGREGREGREGGESGEAGREGGEPGRAGEAGRRAGP